MNIGLIADVHANYPALEAALTQMPAVDSIVCAGDIVGYNPMPSECVDRIREVADIVVQGNHDRLVSNPDRAPLNPTARQGLAFAKRRLSTSQLQWLENLPPSASFGGGEYLLVHSHPENLDEYVFEEEFADLDRYLSKYSGIVLGHTHRQGWKRVDGGLVVNPGSVGQPRDGNPDAAFAVLETESNTVQLKRVPYNIDHTYHQIVVEDLPVESGKRLYDGM